MPDELFWSLIDATLLSQTGGIDAPAPRSGVLPPGALPEEPEELPQGELGHVAVLRPRLSQRKGIYWVTARMWFAPAKLQGLNMLKRAKDEMDEKTLALIGADLLRVTEDVYGAFAGVVCAPSARHSAFKGVPHFASRLAKDLAAATGNTYAELFEVTPADRAGHHPAREKEPPKVRTERLPRDARVLLVVDVATSGQTMEMHTRALQDAGVKVQGLVWCFGQTTGTGK